MRAKPCQNSQGNEPWSCYSHLQNLSFREYSHRDQSRSDSEIQYRALLVRGEVGVDDCTLFLSVRYHDIMLSTMAPQQCLLEVICTFERIQLPDSHPRFGQGPSFEGAFGVS